jgi:hypothetical protein
MDVLGGDVELTEFEAIDVQSVKGVGQGANGFPILLMKGVAKAPVGEDGSTDGPTHGAFDGTHTHKHAGPDGDVHSHSHSHDGDGDHGHDHAGKAASDREAARALVKAIVGRKVDETPDIAGGTAVLAQIADLIIAEAQELKSGQAGEIEDIRQLACAAEMIWCWRTGEEAVGSGSVMPATALMQSAEPLMHAMAEAVTKGDITSEEARKMWPVWDTAVVKAAESTRTQNDLPDSAFAYIEPGGTKDAEGKTTPRSLRHFPVHDAAHTRNALARASQSPFGAKAMPKIKAAAKKFGIDVSDDTSKGAVAPEGTSVDTEPQTGDLATIVKAAVTEASKPLQEQVDLLKAELAKVKALPVPGGPMMSVTRPAKAADGEDWTAKAAYYEEMAETVNDPSTAAGYRQLARQARDKASAS